MIQGCKCLAVGKLAPLPIPESHFNLWTMDFVTDLPLDGGLNGFMVCIEKLTKLT